MPQENVMDASKKPSEVFIPGIAEWCQRILDLTLFVVKQLVAGDLNCEIIIGVKFCII